MDWGRDQLLAIEYCTDVKRRIVGVTGEAGTGKTSIIQTAYRELSKRGRTVKLAAPTGRAARRILEATGIPAFTIHKLLEYGKPDIDENTGEPKSETRPSRNRENPIEAHDIIVDEFMMVNESLYRNLIDALRSGARLLAFGDVNQLPPIEEYEIKTVDGAPFERLLRLPSSVILETVYRQDAESGILENARRIRNGRPPAKRSDFTIDITEYPLKVIRNHISSCLDNGVDYSRVDNQVISPAKRGQLGIHSLNSILQMQFKQDQYGGVTLPRDKWNEQYPVTVHVGEKVICNENIYDLRDFFDRFGMWKGDEPVWNTFIPVPENFQILNGEIGVIRDILPDGTLDIDVGDRVVHVPASFRDHIPRFNRIITRDPRRKLDLAYAVTTHKMQGSECEHLTYIMHSAIGHQVNRNNIYTGVTRAKQSVHLITDMRCLQNGMRLTAQQKSKIYRENKRGWKIEA